MPAVSPYTPMNTADFIEKVETALDASNVGAHHIDEVATLGIVLHAEVEDLLPMLNMLKACEALQLEQLIDVFGADINGKIEITYRLRSLTHNKDLLIKASLPYGGDYTSVGEVYASAWMPERELCEMFGLTLHGHPNPKRLLTTEGLPPFLRKEVAIRSKEDMWG